MKKFSLKSQVHLPFDKAAEFLNSRTTREKHMFIAFFAIAVLAADYFLLLGPTLATFQELGPKSGELQRVRQELIDDAKNAAEIKKKWESTHALIAEQEKMTIPSTAAAALLENLSKEARQAGVKITSVKPVEAPRGKGSKLFSPLPIKFSGIAGTHELGKFLSRLESGPTFFRVIELSITASLTERRHQIEMTLEACQKEPQAGGPA